MRNELELTDFFEEFSNNCKNVQKKFFQKSQIITKLDFFTLPTKVQKLVLFNNSKAFRELHITLF